MTFDFFDFYRGEGVLRDVTDPIFFVCLQFFTFSLPYYLLT
jgi:hypothetical protein